MFGDSHCHLEMEAFEKDRQIIIEESIREGLSYILTVGTEEHYFEEVVKIIDENPSVYGAIGIHPHNSSDLNEDIISKIKNTLTHKKIIAYGEIGLDFFKNYAQKDIQIDAFRKQLELAGQLKLPVIIHSRNAKDETLQIIRETRPHDAGGVIHCFSYDIDAARKMLDAGFYISIAGTITYNNTQKLAEVVKFIPADCMLAETDAPFLTPHPFRGKRNKPHYVKYAVERIAKIRNKDVEDVALCLKDNFKRLFMKGLQIKG